MSNFLPISLDDDLKRNLETAASGNFHCADFDSFRCRSCGWLDQPYATQIASKQAQIEQVLLPLTRPGQDRAELFVSPCVAAEPGQRNKAKLAVAGKAGALLMGMVTLDKQIELAHCPLYLPSIHAALPAIRAWLNQLAIAPYDVRRRVGELKFVLLTSNEGAVDAQSSSALMLRLVVRSETALHLLREHWPSLQARCPSIHVFSVNLQPEPKAVLEGDTEIVISHARALPFELGAIADGGQGSSSAVRGSPNQGSSSAVRGSPTSLQLLLPTQAFFQTHTSIAKQLYQAASRWIQPWCEDFFKQRGTQPRIHDLYCGVGGFALHIAAHTHASVAGFELSQTAIEAAQTAAHHNGVRAHFYQADATRLPERAFAADAFLVNPPRRGLGALLCDAIAQSKAIRLWYSSCNLSTLAADLQRIGTRRPFRLRRVQLFDMFPHTEHFEVLCEVELE